MKKLVEVKDKLARQSKQLHNPTDKRFNEKYIKPIEYDFGWFVLELKSCLLKGKLETQNINKVLEYVSKYSKLDK